MRVDKTEKLISGASFPEVIHNFFHRNWPMKKFIFGQPEWSLFQLRIQT